MFNKKRIIFTGIAIFLIIVLIFSYVNYNSKKIIPASTPTVSATQARYLDKITPGITTEQDVLKNLGEPINSASDSSILQYKSTSPSRNNEISIQKGTVSFVKEIVSYKDTKNLSNLNNQYGESSYLYGPDAVNGYFLYYHPEQGVAYLANPNTGTVLEVWYFPSTTFENFKNLYAPNYSNKYSPSGF